MNDKNESKDENEKELRIMQHQDRLTLLQSKDLDTFILKCAP